MARTKIAIVGMGKIAQDQHRPTLARSPDFELVACVSAHQAVAGIPAFADLQAMLDASVGIEAIAICTPPQCRHGLARQALAAGCHVLLEKPPAATVEEVEDLRHDASKRCLALFAAWHSRHAVAVEPARQWLLGSRVRRVSVVWKEDVRRWHPGQEWIWESGGMGVFDPGINAFSIVTRLLPGRLSVREAELFTPANRRMPIAARLVMADDGGVVVDVDLDFRQTGPQSWDIRIDTDRGTMVLSHGGAKLHINGTEVAVSHHEEYESIYRHFATMVREGGIDADVAPLRLVAESFAIARQSVVDEFEY